MPDDVLSDGALLDWLASHAMTYRVDDGKPGSPPVHKIELPPLYSDTSDDEPIRLRQAIINAIKGRGR